MIYNRNRDLLTDQGSITRYKLPKPPLSSTQLGDSAQATPPIATKPSTNVTHSALAVVMITPVIP